MPHWVISVLCTQARLAFQPHTCTPDDALSLGGAGTHSRVVSLCRRSAGGAQSCRSKVILPLSASGPNIFLVIRESSFITTHPT